MTIFSHGPYKIVLWLKILKLHLRPGRVQGILNDSPVADLICFLYWFGTINIVACMHSLYSNVYLGNSYGIFLYSDPIPGGRPCPFAPGFILSTRLS